MEQTDVSFQGKHDGERVIAVIHRHWFNLLSHMFMAVLLAVVLLGGIFIFPVFFPELIGDERADVFFFIENTFLLFVWLYGFLIWIDVYFDVWIITNERIVNIEQKGLFVRHISELPFSRVQDVTSEVEGILPSILDFGDVFVQTASEQPRFIFRQIPNPIGVKTLVMKLAKGAREDDIEEAVKILSETRKSGLAS